MIANNIGFFSAVWKTKMTEKYKIYTYVYFKWGIELAVFISRLAKQFLQI